MRDSSDWSVSQTPTIISSGGESSDWSVSQTPIIISSVGESSDWSVSQTPIIISSGDRVLIGQSVRSLL